MVDGIWGVLPGLIGRFLFDLISFVFNEIGDLGGCDSFTGCFRWYHIALLSILLYFLKGLAVWYGNAHLVDGIGNKWPKFYNNFVS
jgi:hypothetical protein